MAVCVVNIRDSRIDNCFPSDRLMGFSFVWNCMLQRVAPNLLLRIMLAVPFCRH